MSVNRPAAMDSAAPAPETCIDLIRHGEPVGGRRYRGDGIDDPLSERGWRQMWQAVGEESGRWTQVVSSPLQRCHAFAEALAERDDLPLSCEVDLREVGFGCWEGRSPQEIQRDDGDAFAAFYRDPVGSRPAGAEALAAFSRRTTAAFERVLERYAGGRVLIVAHAGVLRAITAYCLEAPLASIYRLRIDNAAFVSITAQPHGQKVVTGVNLRAI